MECRKCGSDVWCEVISTFPPKTQYRCPKCGILSENDIKLDIGSNQQDMYIQNKEIVDNFDWESYRRNTAQVILASLISHVENLREIIPDRAIDVALKLTDSLIRKLKKGE